MSETQYEHRTDSVLEKIRLLRMAQEKGKHELAISLADSIKDTLTLERQTQRAKASPIVRADAFETTDNLPSSCRAWAEGWSFCKVLALEETEGFARAHEPVDILLSFRSDQTSDLRREVRVARVNPADAALQEVPSQVYGESQQGRERMGRVVFFADVPARGRVLYLVFYGNPQAELPDYVTDLSVAGEKLGLDITNHYYTARLSSQVGQLERLIYRNSGLGLELFASGDGHGEPPHIDWAHDYLASSRFQKFRVTNWASCPNHEIVRGPLCVHVKRWGFPHSPAHPLFTPSRMHISVTYSFYAGLPYFFKESTMEMVKDFDIDYLRDDEWVFTGYPFTDQVWVDRDGRLHEGEVPEAQRNDLWGVGFFNRMSRLSFIALWLEHGAENFDGVVHCGAPALDYMGQGQLWSRWAAQNHPQFKAGACLKQKNAYLVLPYPEKGGAEEVQGIRCRLLGPLAAASVERPRTLEAPRNRALARPGETAQTAPLKPAIWSALREIKDEMFYNVDANVVDMGYIYDLRVRGDLIHVLMTMPHRGRPKYRFLANPLRDRLLRLPGVREVIVDLVWQPPWDVARLTDAGRTAMGLPLHD